MLMQSRWFLFKEVLFMESVVNLCKILSLWYLSIVELVDTKNISMSPWSETEWNFTTLIAHSTNGCTFETNIGHNLSALVYKIVAVALTFFTSGEKVTFWQIINYAVFLI